MLKKIAARKNKIKSDSSGFLHDEEINVKKIKIASVVSFLMGFTQAVIVYIISSYFKIVSGTENVGSFYVVAYLVALFCLLNFHKVVKKFGKAQVFYFSLVLKILAVLILSMIGLSKFGIVLLIIYIIGVSLEWVCLDMILESFSEDKSSGRIRGQHLAIVNVGFIFGPFLATRILDVFSFQGVFSFCLILNMLIFITALLGFRKENHRFGEDINVINILKKVLARRDIVKIYYISFVLDFFYAMMVIYSPIYLQNLGYSWDQIGSIFSIMLVAFVVVQYPMGFLADKKTGEKEFLCFAIFLMGISTMAIYFIGTASLAIWAAVLFVTRIGAAILDVLRDSYFYKRIDRNDVDIIDFFRTSLPVAYILVSALAAAALLFFSVKTLFLLSGLIILSALYPAVKLVDNKCEKEM